VLAAVVVMQLHKMVVMVEQVQQIQLLEHQ
jgi:hypothetical protein